MQLLEALTKGNVVVLGKREWGKTLLAMNAAKLRPSGLTVDTLGDCKQGRQITVDELHHAVRGGWWRLNVKAETKRLRCHSNAIALTAFRFICEAARADLLPKNFCLFVDEADKYGTAAYNDENLREYARYGAHWSDSTYVITARRYAAIPKEWTTNADIILAGASMDPNDGDAARRFFGYSNMQTWSELKLHEFLSLTPQALGIVMYNRSRNTLEAWNLQGGNQ